MRTESGKDILLGSCFSVRGSDMFLTAAHCVGKLDASALVVRSAGIPERRVVLRVVRHPSADLALLEVAKAEEEGVEPFVYAVSNWSLGEDFFAFGYPEDVFGDYPGAPTPRLFKGHFQRFIQTYKSKLGYEYFAAELNIAAPAGLSGGPLFRAAAPVVLGIVTENLESTTFLDSVEQVFRDGQTTRTTYQKVITYGVALMLSPLKEWLNDQREGTCL
jgi:trypsin-like peptidase